MDHMSRARSSFLISAIAVAVVTLSGCTLTGNGGPSNPPTPSETAKRTPAPTKTADAEGTPITIGCNELVSPQAMYAYNPNFSLVADFVPASGTPAADIVDLHGLACEWENQSSGEKIDVAVANLSDQRLEALKNQLVTTSNSVPTYEVEGYFEMNGPTGEANAFDDPYWIVASSATFFEPGDAQPIVAAAINALR
jgi:hypothetical protein